MNRVEINRCFLNAVSLNRVGSQRGKSSAEVWEDYIANGTDAIRIADAKSNSIVSLLLNGGCSQSGTPTPTAPVPVTCNKGAVSYGVLGKNLLEVKEDNIVVGKYINNNGEVTTSLPNLYFQRFVSVKPGVAYTLSTSETLNYANFMEYDSDGVFIKRTLYGSSSSAAGKVVTHTMGETTAFVIIGSNINATKYPEVTKANVMAIKWMFNEGASALKYEAYRAGYSYNGKDDVQVYGKNLSVGELVGKGYASTGGVSTSSTFCGNLHKIPVSEGQKYIVSWGNLPDGLSGVFINTWKTDGTWNARQAISASDNLTYTIPSGVGEVNFTLYKTGGIGIAENTWMQVELGDTATEYVPAVAPQTATAQVLMGVGEYADTQDIISGIVTRKVGVKALNGTEDITLTSGVYLIDLKNKKSTNDKVFCSHFSFIRKTSVSSHTNNLTISSMANSKVTIRYNAIADVESFRQWLQREYSKGTPVIIIYPLASANTENVAGQTLSYPKGDVTILRDADVKGLPMSATLKVKAQGGAEITFNVEGYEDTFKAREGMTWMEWCASEYNIHDWSCDADSDWIFLYGDDGGWFPTNYYLYDNALGYMLTGREKIKGGYTYTIFVDGIGGGGGIE